VKKKTPLKNPRKGLRVAAYVRVSSLRQVHEGDSIKSQKSMITRYVELKAQFKTWEVEGLEFYVEPGRSAKDLNRPELQRLMREVEAGRVDVIVCYKFDRLSRKLRDFLELYEVLHQYGVRVVSQTRVLHFSSTGQVEFAWRMVGRGRGCTPAPGGAVLGSWGGRATGGQPAAVAT
jgi:DNA invertase Pin-like site-specific DNA recombinase